MSLLLSYCLTFCFLLAVVINTPTLKWSNKSGQINMEDTIKTSSRRMKVGYLMDDNVS